MTKQHEELIKLVTEMREAQKKYFATRSREWLNVSKKLEKQVDHVLAESTLFHQTMFE